MKQIQNSQLFLERKSYRQRRLRDAARVLPILGAVLWFIPMMWTKSDTTPTSNADAMLYLFGVWIVLIIISAMITRALTPPADIE